MQHTVIGAGYVGLVLAACLAKYYPVHLVDTDESRVDALRAGQCPIHEPHLEERLKQPSLTAGTAHLETPSVVYWLCVGTPSAPDGEADIQDLLQAARALKAHLDATGIESATVVVKSTVPPGTGKQVEEVINGRPKQGIGDDPWHAVVSCPEFLREGSAVVDMLYPDRVVIGSDDHAAGMTVLGVMEVLVGTQVPILTMRRVEAELVKLASNAHLAMRISFANQLAVLADEVGARATRVLEAVGADKRIGPAFMEPGLGYGGSCFPKDAASLAFEYRRRELTDWLVEATMGVNEEMISWAAEKLERALGDLDGKRIGILGAAFKPGTDDVRCSPGLALAAWLEHEGATVCIADPVVTRVSWRQQEPGFRTRTHMVTQDWRAVVKGADAVVLATAWPEYAKLAPDGVLFHGPTIKAVLDGRGSWYKQGPTWAARGVDYLGIGAPSRLSHAREVTVTDPAASTPPPLTLVKSE